MAGGRKGKGVCCVVRVKGVCVFIPSVDCTKFFHRIESYRIASYHCGVPVVMKIWYYNRVRKILYFGEGSVYFVVVMKVYLLRIAVIALSDYNIIKVQ